MKTFDIGDDVLLLRLMGEEFERPLHAYVIATEVHSRLYAYRVHVPGKPHTFMVKEDWVRPMDLLIQEVPDTPWDDWL
jgi:hypothetical protein